MTDRCSSLSQCPQGELGQCPGVSFRHTVTGTLVSSLWITEAGDRGWVEIKTGDKKLKIMYYDEMVGSRSLSSC